MVLGLARSDDEVGRELNLAEQVLVLERDVELVVHAFSLSFPAPSRHTPEAHFPVWSELKPQTLPGMGTTCPDHGL